MTPYITLTPEQFDSIRGAIIAMKLQILQLEKMVKDLGGKKK